MGDVSRYVPRRKQEVARVTQNAAASVHRRPSHCHSFVIRPPALQFISLGTKPGDLFTQQRKPGRVCTRRPILVCREWSAFVGMPRSALADADRLRRQVQPALKAMRADE